MAQEPGIPLFVILILSKGKDGQFCCEFSSMKRIPLLDPPIYIGVVFSELPQSCHLLRVACHIIWQKPERKPQQMILTVISLVIRGRTIAGHITPTNKKENKYPRDLILHLV
jgi:hypothetical protein